MEGGRKENVWILTAIRMVLDGRRNDKNLRVLISNNDMDLLTYDQQVFPNTTIAVLMGLNGKKYLRIRALSTIHEML